MKAPLPRNSPDWGFGDLVRGPSRHPGLCNPCPRHWRRRQPGLLLPGWFLHLFPGLPFYHHRWCAVYVAVQVQVMAFQVAFDHQVVGGGVPSPYHQVALGGQEPAHLLEPFKLPFHASLGILTRSRAISLGLHLLQVPAGPFNGHLHPGDLPLGLLPTVVVGLRILRET